jgi:hypothetical protein
MWSSLSPDTVDHIIATATSLHKPSLPRGAVGCAISCEESGGGGDCVDQIFANCFNAGGLSPDDCSPAYD